MKIEEIVGRNIRRLRTDRGFTGAQFGELIGDFTGSAWSGQIVSQAETGRRRFAVSDLVLLAFTLDEPVSELLRLPDEVPDVTLDGVTIKHSDAKDLLAFPHAIEARKITRLRRLARTMGEVLESF